jgi:hypothetical protein
MPHPSVMACHPRHITHYTEHARSLVTIHALSRDLPDHTRRSNTGNTTVVTFTAPIFRPVALPNLPVAPPNLPV